MTIPDGFSQISLFFSGPAVPTGAEVTFGVDNNGGTAVSVLDTIEGVLADSSIENMFSSSASIVTIKVKNGPDDVGPTAEGSFLITGTRDEATENSSTSILVRKSTALGGRANRGRMFWPAVAAADTTIGGNVEAAAVTIMQTTMDSLLDNLATADVPMVVLHQGAGAPTAVTALTVQGICANQRQRQRR